MPDEQPQLTKDPELPANYDPVAEAKRLVQELGLKVELGDITVVLSPTDFPPNLPLVDHTAGIPRFGQPTGTARQDELNELNPVQLALMLAKSDIYMRPPAARDGAHLGTMHAFVAGASLTRADQAGVRFKKVSLLNPEVGQIDTINYSYHAYESSIQQQLGIKTKAQVGVPKVFKFAASYNDTSASSDGSKGIWVHFQASQLFQKAKLVFAEEDIELTPEFVDKIKRACEANDGKGSAPDILKCLREYGHFVALNTLLGGRITLLESKELKQSSEFNSHKANFEAAAAARFVYEGVQFDAGLGAGVGTSSTVNAQVNAQALSLSRELRGGKSTGGPSDKAIVGSDWLDSIGPYTGWRIIGFQENSLVPTIQFLPEPTRKNCKAILKRYFASHLEPAKSAAAGHEDNKEFDQDIKNVKHLSRIEVNHEGNIDGLRLTYEMYKAGGGTEMITTPWFGRDRGANHTATIDMKKGYDGEGDEALVGIRAMVDSKHDRGYAVRQLAFETTRRRYPEPDRFYGRNKGDHEVHITAPRIKGLFGRTGAWVHCIGVRYLRLVDSVAADRDYLLTMEEYLFPDRDYGVTGG